MERRSEKKRGVSARNLGLVEDSRKVVPKACYSIDIEDVRDGGSTPPTSTNFWSATGFGFAFIRQGLVSPASCLLALFFLIFS